MSNVITYQIKDAVAQILFNRPEVYNSFNRTMALGFLEVLEDCQNNDEVRALVISGTGKAFCAGQDLKEITEKTNNLGFKQILEEQYNPIIKKLCDIQKPIVAAVNGVAAGAGANIALACDIVIAAENASFIQAFSSIGLIPDSGGTYFLPRLIGFQKAKALAFLGDKVTADQAEKMGMIYKSVPQDEFEGTITDIAIKLAQMPTKALGLIKHAFANSMQNTLEEQLQLESKLQIEASQTADYHEGVSAFIEKRKPKFKGC